jgi:hypothetical protein
MRVVTLTKDIFSPKRGERASEERTWVREVDLRHVPVPTNTEELLELVFEQGQNDFQPRTAPSLSAGDIIVLDDANGREPWQIDPIGFTKLHMHLFTPAERLMIRFATSNLPEAKAHQFEEAERAMHANGADPEAIERFRKSAATRG